MKQPRQECDLCQNFIEPVLSERGFIKVRAKCQLGKRVMFRIPTDWRNGWKDMGYFRYCDEYKQIEK